MGGHHTGFKEKDDRPRKKKKRLLSYERKTLQFSSWHKSHLKHEKTNYEF